jgi:hypothetical protein
MAFYTQNVKTQIFNAVFDSGKYRSQFNLTNDTLYMSNLRLLNVGLTAISNGQRYNLVNGVGSIIKNITLYSDNTVIDKVINFADYSAFQQYNKTNQANSDVSKLLLRNGLGFVYERTPDTDSTPTAPNPITIKEFFPNAPDIPTTLTYTTVMGFLNLREVFPILKGAGGLQFLHTGMLKNLKLVIEYTTVDTIVADPVGATGAVDTTTLPILVADSITDPSVASKFLSDFKQQQWVSSELETVVLEAQATAGVQFQKFRLTGAESKFVNSILIQKKGSSSVSRLYAGHGSETMLDERIQLYTNGSAHLPENGVVSAMQRLALLHDSFGVSNTHTGASDLSMYNPANFVDAGLDRIGHLDWFGCIVNKRITSLDLDYSRTIATGALPKYSQQIKLNVFYGVLKALIKTPKGFEVVYV